MEQSHDLLLRDALLFLWSRAVVDAEVEHSQVNAARIHLAISGVADGLRSLGVPVVFDRGPQYPHSRQVSAAIDELTPFGVTYENSAFFRVVLERRRAQHHLVLLEQRLSEASRRELTSLAPTFRATLET